MGVELRQIVYWTVSVFLAMVLVAGIGGLGYIATTPTPSAAPYTEFYVLGPDGQAAEYPDTVAVGETGEVIVGITNREHHPQTYTIGLKLAGEQIHHETVQIPDEATWEEAFQFTPTQPGDQDLDVSLYLGGDRATDGATPYRSVQVQLTVTEA